MLYGGVWNDHSGIESIVLGACTLDTCRHELLIQQGLTGVCSTRLDIMDLLIDQVFHYKQMLNDKSSRETELSSRAHVAHGFLVGYLPAPLQSVQPLRGVLCGRH